MDGQTTYSVGPADRSVLDLAIGVRDELALAISNFGFFRCLATDRTYVDQAMADRLDRIADALHYIAARLR